MKRQRTQYQFFSESDWKHNRQLFLRDAIVLIGILITTICISGILLLWRYGVEIDHFIYEVTK